MSTRPCPVHYATTERGTAVLDTRPFRGRWRFMDPLTAELWTAILSGTPADGAIDSIAGQVAARSNVTADRVRQDLRTVASDLDGARLLAPAHPAAARPAPTVRFATPAVGQTAIRAAAATGLALTLVVLRCAPLRWTIAVATAATRLPSRTATVAEVERLHAAVRRAARIWPGRAACLEESLATFLAAALTGRRCRWVLGAAFLPQGAHAWVEAGGSVVGQAEQDRIWPYTPVLEVERSN
ncbi:lasso peptide biosynthesis B2 protein [Streptomyces sp. NBC_01336]|uniref:lasso peptide biosynthesis B2 protein n=1 Tax=Streptomyces sp. NBC_01336 TaxID=2903829 RepID=UPI002E161806|nr:lasso peptide biosynthesis B2 protein [Streptomyces sp. NBC_01336]